MTSSQSVNGRLVIGVLVIAAATFVCGWILDRWHLLRD